MTHVYKSIFCFQDIQKNESHGELSFEICYKCGGGKIDKCTTVKTQESEIRIPKDQTCRLSVASKTIAVNNSLEKDVVQVFDQRESMKFIIS